MKGVVHRSKDFFQKRGAGRNKANSVSKRKQGTDNAIVGKGKRAQAAFNFVLRFR